jgi:NAD(P)-dependent dehydrogenase (short-subunit alcohol dehydrogenase family)
MPDVRPLFDLTGRVALVTGAGRGLGRAIALGLARAGADIAAAARTAEELERLVDEVRQLGRRGSAHPLDVTRVDAIEAVVADVVAVHGGIDILVNNAGTKVPQSALDTTEEAWDHVLDVNLKGAFFCARAVGRHMVARGSGKIVNVASTYAVVGAPNRATYAASKGGLLQLTRVLAIEWAPHGVNVNAVGPTAALTSMNEGVLGDEDFRRQVVARIPAGRLATPDDVVGPVVFLASPASDLVNGHLLLVDGGFTAL